MPPHRPTTPEVVEDQLESCRLNIERLREHPYLSPTTRESLVDNVVQDLQDACRVLSSRAVEERTPLETALRRERADNNSLRAILQHRDEDLRIRDGIIAELQNGRAPHEELFDQMMGRTAPVLQELSRLEPEALIAELERRTALVVDTLNQELVSLRAMYRSQCSATDSMTQQYHELVRPPPEMRGDFARVSAELSRTREEVERLQREVSEDRDCISDLNKELDDALEELRELRDKVRPPAETAEPPALTDPAWLTPPRVVNDGWSD